LCLAHDQLSRSLSRLIPSLPPSKIRRRHRRKILLRRRNLPRIPRFEIQILLQRTIPLRTTPSPNWFYPRKQKAAFGFSRPNFDRAETLPPTELSAGGRLHDACANLRNRKLGRRIMRYDGILTDSYHP
jgi:hypothetical protein